MYAAEVVFPDKSIKLVVIAAQSKQQAQEIIDFELSETHTIEIWREGPIFVVD